MIMKELSALYDKGLDVTISVPGGKELAQRTFNPKLGIVDGISIIGTSGIVRPFSSEAFCRGYPQGSGGLCGCGLIQTHH